MNLYEFEGKQLLQKYGITTPKGVVVRRGDDAASLYSALGISEVVVKAQVLSGKRGKNNGIVFCSSADEVVRACNQLFTTTIRGQHVASALVEEKIVIAREEYVSIVYNTTSQQPMILYSREGGMDIEEVSAEKIVRAPLDIRVSEVLSPLLPKSDIFQKIWNCFLAEDTRQIEINPLIITTDGRYVAADAKIALDEDAFYRHEEWSQLEPRTMMGRLPTEREVAVKKIDEGEGYYRGTAGKYIEMDGDIAILFSGGGASIANMDALIKAGLKPANYTEYSGNPPREKVRELAKIVLSKPGLRGLWIAGGVANFTNIAETFHGIVDALDEIKPNYPIVIRRAGPFEEEGMRLMKSCAERNGLMMHFFGKETSMSDTAGILARLIV
jgi:citryl-CoA synthetase large subunit